MRVCKDLKTRVCAGSERGQQARFARLSVANNSLFSRPVFVQLRCRKRLLELCSVDRDGKEQQLKLTLDLGTTYQDMHEYALAMPMLEEAYEGEERQYPTLLCL